MHSTVYVEIKAKSLVRVYLFVVCRGPELSIFQTGPCDSAGADDVRTQPPSLPQHR